MLLQKYLQVLSVDNISGLNVLTVFRYDYIAVVDIDEVIMPKDTRIRLIEGFDSLENKRDRNPPKKHGNIPL